MESKSGKSSTEKQYIDLEGEEDDQVDINVTGSSEDNEFDEMIGKLEEVLLSDEFAAIQKEFYRQHASDFDVEGPSDENKPEYMIAFREYTELMESTIGRLMQQRITTFTMSRFESLISARPDEISGEISDLLVSMGDYNEFKEVMINAKRNANRSSSKSGKSVDLAITGRHIA